MSAAACLWCGVAFPAKTQGGHRKLFCRDLCRAAAGAAARAWGPQELEAGRTTLEALSAAVAKRDACGEANG